MASVDERMKVIKTECDAEDRKVVLFPFQSHVLAST